MPRKRTPRKEIKLQPDFLKPIDILGLGSDDDPCFGKLHDLNAEECRECGDSDFCAIVKAQNLHKERLTQESNQRFKDIEDAEKETFKKKELAKEKIDEYKKKGFKRLKTILTVAKELNLTKDQVKQVYDHN